MTFQPNAADELQIDGELFKIAEHPRAPGIPYGQEGRQAVVYQLSGEAERRALKIFKPRYRVPGLVGISRRVAPLASMAGLRVCNRTVLTPQQDEELLRQYPDLTYSVLMPWIEGPTWMEVLVRKRELTPEQSLVLARGLAEVLSGMEQEGLAHCDLSGPNVLLPALSANTSSTRTSAVELVDVEQMFGPDLKKPELIPSGSPGYAHRSAQEGTWSSDADRFAGALLIAEMLAWCNPVVRQEVWGESYFDPAEMQLTTKRFELMFDALAGYWGAEVATLVSRAWRSSNLSDAPTFGEWLVTMPKTVAAHGVFRSASSAFPLAERKLQQPSTGVLDASSHPATSELAVASGSSAVEGVDVPVTETVATSLSWTKLPPRPTMASGSTYPPVSMQNQQLSQKAAHSQVRYLDTRQDENGQTVLTGPRNDHLQQKPKAGRMVGLVVTMLVIALGIVVFGVNQAQTQANEHAAATATERVQAAAISTVQAQDTGTSVASTMVANEVANETRTAQAIAWTNTTNTAVAVGQALGTATAQSATTYTAGTQATAVARAMATSTAEAESTRTFIVQQTATAQANEAASNWPSWGYDLGNTFWNKNEVVLRPPLKVEWTYSAPGNHVGLEGLSIEPNGIVAGGSEIATNNDYKNVVFGIDLHTGTHKWKFTLAHGRGAMSVTPAIFENYALFGGEQDEQLYALDIRTGVSAWQDQFGDLMTKHPKIMDGAVYVTSESAGNSGKGETAAFDARTGQKKWSINSGAQSTLAIEQGMLLRGGLYQPLTGIDASTGKVKWTREIVGGYQIVTNDGQLYVMYASSALASPQSPVLNVDRIVALRVKDGTEIWQSVLPEQLGWYSQMALVNDTLYVAGMKWTQNGGIPSTLYALDSSTGTIKGRRAGLGDHLLAANGVLYACGYSTGTLYGLRPETLDTIWQDDIGGCTDLVVAEGHLYVAQWSQLLALENSP